MFTFPLFHSESVPTPACGVEGKAISLRSQQCPAELKLSGEGVEERKVCQLFFAKPFYSLTQRLQPNLHVISLRLFVFILLQQKIDSGIMQYNAMSCSELR